MMKIGRTVHLFIHLPSILVIHTDRHVLIEQDIFQTLRHDKKIKNQKLPTALLRLLNSPVFPSLRQIQQHRPLSLAACQAGGGGGNV